MNFICSPKFYAQSSVEFEKQNVGSLLQSSILRYMNSWVTRVVFFQHNTSLNTNSLHSSKGYIHLLRGFDVISSLIRRLRRWQPSITVWSWVSGITWCSRRWLPTPFLRTIMGRYRLGHINQASVPRNWKPKQQQRHNLLSSCLVNLKWKTFTDVMLEG